MRRITSIVWLRRTWSTIAIDRPRADGEADVVLSTFTWLDHDAEQARRAAELVRALSEPTTVDSIGVGSVRDGIAGILFPGTSTIQTRVRYFLLVPWAMQAVARRRPKDRAQYDRFLTDIETATISSLVTVSPAEGEGIIGRQKGAATKRKASSVYWAGLGEWGIRIDSGLTMAGHRSMVLSRGGPQLVDDDAGEGPLYRVWDEIPFMPDAFPASPLRILPTADEAEYLRTKMQMIRVGPLGGTQGGGSPSLLAPLADDPELAWLDWPWDIPEACIPERLRSLLWHARSFSLVVQGARLRYDLDLFRAYEKAGWAEHETRGELDVLVEDWLREMADAHSATQAWVPELEGLFDELARFGVSIGEQTRRFVRDWCRVASSDPEGAMSSAQAGAWIRDRESVRKGANARLTNEAPLRAWDGALFGADRLDFRWGTARRLVRDCAEGAEVDRAGA